MKKQKLIKKETKQVKLSYFQNWKFKRQERIKQKILFKLQKKELIKEIKSNLKVLDEKRDIIIDNDRVLNQYNKFKKLKQYDIKKRQPLISKIITGMSKTKPWIIHMQTANGDLDEFIVRTNEKFFLWGTGAYIIDENKKSWNSTSKMFMLKYHHDISLPYSIDINSDEVKQALKENGADDIELSIEPNILKRFITSNFVEKVMKGAELGKDLNLLKILMIINLLVSIPGFFLLLSIVMRK